MPQHTIENTRKKKKHVGEGFGGKSTSLERTRICLGTEGSWAMVSKPWRTSAPIVYRGQIVNGDAQQGSAAADESQVRQGMAGAYQNELNWASKVT